MARQETLRFVIWLNHFIYFCLAPRFCVSTIITSLQKKKERKKKKKNKTKKKKQQQQIISTCIYKRKTICTANYVLKKQGEMKGKQTSP